MSGPAGEPLWALDAATLADGFRAGALTPVEALAAVHDRIDAINPAINAIIAEDRAAARAQAATATERWAAGKPRSALDGVPLTIKDNIIAAGLPATWGSRAYADFWPQDDEPAVARLRAAGDVQQNRFLLRFTDAATDRELTVFPDGRAIISGTTDGDEARRLYATYIGV